MPQYDLFEQQWSDDKNFRDRLLKFCTKDKSDENIRFLLDVESYMKVKDPFDRAIEEERIMRKYMNNFSRSQLNVNDRAIERVRVDFVKNPGNTGAFQEIVEEVKHMIVTDVYPRFSTWQDPQHISHSGVRGPSRRLFPRFT